jgi:hypothetical protein
MVESLKGYKLISSDVVTVKNDLGLCQDFKVSLHRNNKGQKIITCEPHVDMPYKSPCKLPTDLFPPNNYKVNNG